MRVEVECSECHQKTYADAHYIGKTTKCPHCGRLTAISRPTKKPVAAEAEAVPPLPTSPVDRGTSLIRFRCVCGKRLKAAARFAGQLAKCPACGSRVQVPLNVETQEADTPDQVIKQTICWAAGIDDPRIIAKVQGTLEDCVKTGPSFSSFKRKIQEALGPLPAPTAEQLEFVFRSHVQGAYATNRDQILAHPLVDDEFPYALLSPINDARTSDEHLETQRRGIQGTAVYRQDDPVFLRYSLHSAELSCISC